MFLQKFFFIKQVQPTLKSINYFSKTKSQKMWIHEHINDPYVKQAIKFDYRSRASFKLLQIQERYKIIQQNNSVIDLGSSPGGWTQVAVDMSKSTKEKPQVLAIDKDEMLPVNGAHFIKGDLTNETVQIQIAEFFKMQPVDIILSDMAPNFSGDLDIDHSNISDLNILCLFICDKHLKIGGNVLMKTLNGSFEKTFFDAYKIYFKDFQRIKPAASRSKSSEIYYLGRGYKLSQEYLKRQKLLKKIDEQDKGFVQPDLMSEKEQSEFLQFYKKVVNKLISKGVPLTKEEIESLKQVQGLNIEWDNIKQEQKPQNQQQNDDPMQILDDLRKEYGDKLTFTRKFPPFSEEYEKFSKQIQDYKNEIKKQGSASNSSIGDKDEALFLSDDEYLPNPENKSNNADKPTPFENLFFSQVLTKDYQPDQEKDLSKEQEIKKKIDEIFSADTLNKLKSSQLNFDQKEMERIDKLFENKDPQQVLQEVADSQNLSKDQIKFIINEINETQDIIDREKVGSFEEFMKLKSKKERFNQEEEKKLQQFEKLFKNLHFDPSKIK